MANDADQALKIHVVSDADNSGFKSAADASQDLQKGTDQASDGTKKLGEAGVKASEAAAEQGIKQHELKKVLMEIGNVAAPGAGRALAELALGPVGAALALVAVFEMVRHSIEDTAAEQEKFAEQAAQPMTGGLVALKTAWKDAQSALADYYSALDKGGADKDPIATQIERVKQIEAAQIEAIKNVIAELGKQEIAFLRARGGTPDQIADAEERTRRELAAKDEEKGQATGSASLYAEQQTRLQQSGRLIAEANAAIDRKKAADKRLADLDAEKKNLEAESGLGDAGKNNPIFQAEEKELARLQKERDARAKQYNGGDSYVAGVAKAEMDRLDTEIAGVEKRRQARQTRLAQLDEDYFSTVRAQKNAAADVAIATGRSETNQARLRQLPGEIPHAQKLEGITQHTDEVTRILNQHGGNLNQTLGALAAATGKTHQQTLNIVEGIIHGQASFAKRMAQLEAQVCAGAHTFSR